MGTIGNEALAMAQPAVESQAVQEAAFSYQRTDGTVERANSVEDAMARCRVLGKMSLDQASVMLELATLGNEVIAKETIEKDISYSNQEDAQKSDPVERASVVQPSKKATKEEMRETPEPMQARVDPVIAKQVSLESMSTSVTQQIRTEAIRSKAQKSVEPRVVEQPLSETVDRVVIAELERQQYESSMKDEVYDADQIVDVSDNLIQLPLNQLGRKPEATKAIEVRLENTEPLYNKQGLALIERETTAIVVDATDKDVSKQVTVELSRDEVTVDAELQTNEAEYIISEPLYDREQREEIASENVILQTADSETISNEVMDVYDELAAILYEQEQSQDVVMQPVEGLIINDIEVSNQSQNSLDFESYISAQPILEQQPSLENILTQVNVQPLEQTMLQVAVFVSKEAEPTDDRQELLQIITELREVVLKYTENGETYPQLTPEITEKLIRLLEVLGYHKPSDALTECVSTRGYLFLWQAIEYVVDQEKRTELGVKAVSIIAPNNDDDISNRVAKFLFGLIGVLSAEPIT